MVEPHCRGHVEAVERALSSHAWTDARIEHAWHVLVANRDRTLRMRRVGVAMLAFAATLVLMVLALQNFRTPPAETGSDEATLERLAFADGSEVRFEAGAEVTVRERTDTRVVVSVGAGKARFRVRHDPRRIFRVEARDVAIEDLGTTFDVAVEGESVRVFVSDGAVRVSFAPAPAGARRSVTLNAGQSGTYPVGERSPASETGFPPKAPAAPQSNMQAPDSLDVQKAADWRALARAGKHRRAYELLAPNAFRDVRNDPQDLLLASDVARLSQHPAESAMLLRKLLTGHERDPSAPSAAFKLGWVLMSELGRPRDAARAFARAESLSPRGNLAEDAIARCVEAWYRAGELSRAKAEVRRYRASYPNGRHTATLQRLVGTP